MIFLDDSFDHHDELVAAAHDIHPVAIGGPSAIDLRQHLVAPRGPRADEQGELLRAGERLLTDEPLVGLATHGC